MKTIYLDNDFVCHLTDDGTRQAVQTDAFDGKCDVYIEGYRYIPDGQTWTRSDGQVFKGLMIAPAKDYAQLAQAQSAYEQAQAEELEVEADLMDEIEDLCNELIGE